MIKNLGGRLHQEKKLRVIFLNDLGFQYGAGMAHLRQIQSFLLLGHEVRGICWMDGIEGSIPFVPAAASGAWLGMCQLVEVHASRGYTEEQIIQAVLAEIKTNLPDVVIVGNLHASGWSLKLLPAIQALGVTVVAYMHDCHLISGRCAYPGDCLLYKTGCDQSCPTAHEYPALAPAKISAAWHLRREIFCGPQGIPLATNSQWTLKMAQEALPHLNYAEVVYLGLDTHLFKPIDRSLARQLLGLPQDQVIILSGAVNVSDRRKGTHLFREVVKTLHQEVEFLVFGAESLGMKRVQATGLLRDYRKMPLLYSAADLFVNTALEEAFGLTLCEAAACALPIVTFKAGGISEVARHNLNARLVDSFRVEDLLTEIQFFIENPHERITFGQAGRALVEAEFSLSRQAQRWEKYLSQVIVS